jgi:hypothetical protein
MNRVLSFDKYHKLFEAEESNGATNAAEQIVNLFYQAYGSVVTKVGDYKDAIDDLLSVAEEKDATKKADLFESVLKKVVAKIKPEYSEIGNTVLESGKKLKDAYSTLLETEEGKKLTASQRAQKRYYEKNKQQIIHYINEYTLNRRKTDTEYRQKVNEYYKKRYVYDDTAKQKKKEYYLQRKQQKLENN